MIERIIILTRIVGLLCLLGALFVLPFIIGSKAVLLIVVAWVLLDCAMHAQKKLGKEIISWNSDSGDPRTPEYQSSRETNLKG